MKRYLVVGNPIEHSLSPTIHNYWFKKYNISAIYEKQEIKENDKYPSIAKLDHTDIDNVAHGLVGMPISENGFTIMAEAK